MLQRASQLGMQLNVYQLQAAARGAHIEIVRWLLLDTNAAFWQPKFHNGVFFVNKLCRSQCGFAFECAAIGGSVDILRLLKSHPQSVGWNNNGIDVCAAAAVNGHLAALQWARAEGNKSPPKRSVQVDEKDTKRGYSAVSILKQTTT